MREYELMMILHPDLDETALSDTMKRVIGWIGDEGGTITKSEMWGKRELAYPIRKLSQGQYVLSYVTMTPKTCAVLERNLRLLEPVLRFLIVVKE